MHACKVVVVFLGLILMIAGCASSDARQARDAQLRARLADHGLEAGPEHVRWWSDPSGRTTFVLCHKGSDWQRDYSLMLLRTDREQPTIVDLQGVDLNKQWVDSEGKLWSMPAYVTDELKAANWFSIDESSGLFVACGPKPSTRNISVGQMDNAEGWLFTDTLPPQMTNAVHVHAKGPNVIVSEDWSFKVNGVKDPRPHHWVYSPDPGNPGRYARTDSYW